MPTPELLMESTEMICLCKSSEIHPVRDQTSGSPVV